MYSEMGKSFRKIFQERITSPLYGSFIISWMIWNWKIIYLTIFVNQDIIKPQTKIDYILFHYVNWFNLILYPLLSAIALIGFVPLLANEAYHIHLFYEKKRRDWKEKFDSGQRLTIEQSVRLRNDLYEQNIGHQKQLDAKDKEIKIHKDQVEVLVIDKIKLQEQFNELYERTNKFNVLFASYGKNESQKDVTETVKKILETKKKFSIRNTELGGDPLPGAHKVLQIIYISNNVVTSLNVKEYYDVELTSENSFITFETNESRSAYRKELQQKGISSLEYLFPGKWRLEFSGHINGSEEVEIKDGNKYFAKAKGENSFSHVFNLENISIDLNIGRINFEKNSIYSGGRRVVDILKVVEIGSHYEGVEEDGQVNVLYKKIG